MIEPIDPKNLTQPELLTRGVRYAQKDVLEMLRRRQTARIVEDVKYRIDAGEFDAPENERYDLATLKQLVDTGEYNVTGEQVAKRWIEQELEVIHAFQAMETVSLPEYNVTRSMRQEVKTLLLMAYLATIHVLAACMILELMRRAAGG